MADPICNHESMGPSDKFCPSCGRAAVAKVPRNSMLTDCSCCGRDVSIRAAQCQACGEPRHPFRLNVEVVDIDKIPMWSMAAFMVKWTIAVIPAALALAIIGGVAFLLLAAIGLAGR